MTSPVIPVTGKTSIYEIEYLVDGEPMFHTRAKLQRNSEKLEYLLQQRALAPPAAQDLATLSGRVTTLEGRVATLEDPARAKLLPPTSGVPVAYPNGTYNPVVWGSAPLLRGGWVWAANQPTRLTWTGPPSTFNVSGAVAFAVNATNSRLAALAKNGVANLVPGSAATAPTNAHFHAVLPIPTLPVDLATNDYLELIAYQNSGAALGPPPYGSTPEQAANFSVRLVAKL